jgi:hypothetical protein
MGRRRTVEGARCFEHPGSHVVSLGVRERKSGLTRRYRCSPALGEVHTFSVRVTGEVSAGWSPPPACPDHDGSKVVRNGTYGKGTPKPRQRYRCTPADGAKPHSFTPLLPRDHVHEGDEHCSHCDELRGVHRGDTAVARKHSWSTRVVARALEQLAAGGTYAEVSRWAVRVSKSQRTRTAPPSSTAPKETSQASRSSRNAWHIAADWVEAFGPVVYAPIEERLRAAAVAERDRLDALIVEGQPLDQPQVILVDDVPVYGRDLDRKSRSRRDYGYFILVVAELHWPDPDGQDPFGAGGAPRLMLRLVRAMPKSNTPAWRLVFDELGYDPDFVVADAGTGISAAIRAHYDPAHTRFVPSLWHLGQKVEEALTDTPRARRLAPSGSSELIGPLADQLRKLSRSSGVLDDAAAWSSWWDELMKLLASHRLPSEKIRKRRSNYEPAMSAVLADLASHPGVPVSTGGLETLIAKQVKPLLAMRRTSFGNIERTNSLMDLVVARQHGAFDDLGEVAALLRRDTEAHQGYTVSLRSIADPRPRGGNYSSLRDTTLLSTLAKQKGLG